MSFSGIGIELGNLSGHRTLITLCKLIANYIYFESGKSQGILKAFMSGNPVHIVYANCIDTCSSNEQFARGSLPLALSPFLAALLSR